MVAEDPDVARLSAARGSRTADVVNRVCDPVVLVPAVLLLVATTATGSVRAGLVWAALAATFCVGLPYALLLVLVRRGTVTDRHVVVRDQRRLPLAGAVASVAAGVAVLTVLGAPAPVTALVVAMLTGLVSISLVSLVHKASVHVAVSSGAAVICATVLGAGWGLLVLAVAVVVAWARVRSGRHTSGQVLVGLVVGAATAGGVYPLLAG